MPTFSTTPDFLAAIAGAILSLLFSYVPGLNTQYAALVPVYKRLVMLGLLLVVAAAIYGLGCGGILQSGIACSQQGLIQLVAIFVIAVIANQSTFTISPQMGNVTNAKVQAKLAASPLAMAFSEPIGPAVTFDPTSTPTRPA